MSFILVLVLVLVLGPAVLLVNAAGTAENNTAMGAVALIFLVLTVLLN